MSFFRKIKEKFLNSKFPLVGVDISDSSIEFVQLGHGRNKPKVKSSFRQVIKAGLVENGEIIDAEKLGQILREAFSKASPRFSSTSCLLSLPDKLTYFEIVKVDKAIEDWQSYVYSLAQEQLPLNLAEYYYDFLLAKEKKNKYEVFFVAAEIEKVDKYLELFKQAGLQLEAIDFESACLLRALLNEADQAKSVLLADLGAVSSDLILHDKFGFRDQTNLPFGGYVLTAEISQILKIEALDAEKLKKQDGLFIKQGKLDQILPAKFDDLFAEIKNMQAAYLQKTGRNIEKLILAGGTSLLKGVKELCVQKLPDLAIEIGDPGQKIDFSPEFLKNDKILYSNVLGLALRGLNKESLEQGINLIKLKK